MFLDPVVVEEKVDGSQFSFGVFPEPDSAIEEGCTVYDQDRCRVRVRSKGAEMLPEAPEKMFQKAVDWVLANERNFRLGWTYRAEYLAKPKHNALAYGRAPKNHLILFDINPAHEEYLPYEVKAEEASRLGLEVVPLLHSGMVESAAQFREYLDRESVLGGQKIEGVVAKNYARFEPNKKVLMAKFVSEAFKEVHAREWKAENPTQGDIVQVLIQRYHSAARWQKAVMHLREQGKIEDSPRDIGLLMREIWPDIEREEKEAIKDALYAWAQDKVRRGVTAGLPEWYKEQLLRKQFESPQD